MNICNIILFIPHSILVFVPWCSEGLQLPMDLARRVESRWVVHGALVGVVAALFYLGLAWGQPQPLLYRIAHGLKVVGGAAGGVVASRRKMSGPR